MKAAELRALSVAELRQKEKEIRKELMELRFQKSIGRLDNPAKYRQLKRDLARVLTVIREKELGIR
ncbi:large subunit ribosomal protein L29 [Thermosulfidibacter takaii ABI70S6]|uniref:Large ribosomal subunit protein uL29 n=1 Tax=Thermosulfidibacter takaii (strain DSM 17441 / JCM 13301 / NBRC 103674 / ABI70S6) TaxID=1298851 RepID=A0A0S3QV50_THET7|nr:50S ribosomal protein L29 [Thermosulfidibacter takaii]BAT72214.1 large subunit ribosomal protein L29 [Thermosulfidibacter takaii ABI70S6]